MAEEKKGILDRIKSSRLGKALFFAGAMTAASFGMSDKAEAAEVAKEQGDVTKVAYSVHVEQGMEAHTLQEQRAILDKQIIQLSRQKMVQDRLGNTAKANEIFKEMQRLDMQRSLLAQQMADQQKSQTQLQPQVQQNQQEVQQQVHSEKEAFNESLKVPPRMTDEEYNRIKQEAIDRGDKVIRNPEWIKEFQLRRQEAAMKKFQERQTKVQENREQGQEIGG